MWTKKSAAVLGLAIGLIFLGLITRSLPLMALSLVLFVYLLAALPFNRLGRIEPDRMMSNEKIFEDGQLDAVVRLTSSRGTGFVEVRDDIPPTAKLVRGSNYTFLNLKAKGSTRLEYSIECPIKGVYSLGPLMLRAHDPFNLFYKERTIDRVDTITVFPKIVPIKELKIRSKQPKMYPGEVKVRMPGPGAEFWAIREYRPGDPFKDINWKAFGRKRKLLVNEHQRESVSDITIVLDARAASNYGTVADNGHVWGARAAATLTNFFLNRRDSVQLIVYGEKVHTIKPGSGKKQLFEILTTLANANPKGNIPLKGIADVALPFMPRRSPVILISSLDDDDTIRRAISEMSILDFEITIITPASLSFELMAAKERGETIDPLVYDILKLERDLLIAELRGYGVRVVEWEPGQPLTQVLLAASNC